MKYNLKKIIAFDLDGTLAISKSPVTDKMADILIELAKNKIVVIISGGSFEQFKNQFLPPFLRKDNKNEYIKNIILLPTSGSQRYEYDLEKNDWVLTDIEQFAHYLKDRIFHLLNEVISSSEYEIPKEHYGKYIEDRNTQISFSALGQEAPIEKKSLWDPDQEKRKKIVKFLEPLLPEVTIVIGGTTTIDILPKGFDKGVGLLRLINKLDIKKEDMLFVGDKVFPGGNDYAPSQAGIDSVNVKDPNEAFDLIKSLL